MKLTELKFSSETLVIFRFITIKSRFFKIIHFLRYIIKHSLRKLLILQKFKASSLDENFYMIKNS